MIKRQSQRKSDIAGIYRIISPSGRVYIGQSFNIKNRWRLHKNPNAKGMSFLKRSFEKYGIAQHRFEILHQLPIDVSEQTMNEYEILYLNQHKDVGFKMINVKEGGGNARWTEDMRQKMLPKLLERLKRNAFKPNTIPWNKGKKMPRPPWNKGISGVYKASEETRKKQSVAFKKRPHPCLGIKRSLEAIRKTAEKNRGKKRTEEVKKLISHIRTVRPNRGGVKNKGVVRSEEFKKLHSDIQKARSDNKGEFHNMAKLNKTQVDEIRKKFKPRIYSSRMLAEEYRISKTNVLDIIHNRIWNHDNV